MRRSLQEAEETKMLKLLFVLTARRKSTSDLIWRELELTKKVKPIVVSMGICRFGRILYCV
jgi:protease-4